VRDERAGIRIGAELEQQPDVLEPVLVECVRQRVRAARRGAVLEQEPQALRALRLGGVVERLAVVRVRARLEQQPRELGMVHHPGRAVERRHLTVLVDEERVRIGAALEQLAPEAGGREARVTDV
jgi:hypothetical protein